MKKIAIGLSGGVDSSAAALLLLEQGYDVTGVILRLKPDNYADSDIADAQKIADCLGIELHIQTDYTGIGKLQYLFAQKGINVIDTEYATDVVVKAMIPIEEKEAVEKAITEQTNGQAVLEWKQECYYALRDKEILFF